ncbi:YesL family protein [Metabacillus halosaccharovorans]|uniref:YesL family protein n=1 Tax=Metabacillus halosaccharovorans TaxID=930124 RepID=UPI001C1F8961|nr:DUF624 domain-containing protein [Metabacillus halosaccharovorans]MBU7591653.1 DUF624 domain-containing protein [Metabacillus halosaccharovorans]
MTNVMGGLNRLFEWIMRLSVINIMWIIFNLPICYLAMSLLFAEDEASVFLLLGTIAVLAPFMFFPATTAMFGVVRKWVMGDDDVPLVKSYWRFYKENYVRSLTGGLLLTLFWVIWTVDFFFFSKVNVFVSAFFLIGFLFLFLMTLFFFSNTVHAELKLLTSVKNAFFLTMVYPLINMVVLVFSGVILYISLGVFTFLVPFFMGTLITYVGFAAYYQKMEKINKKSVVETK